jgi:N-acetylglutamate synthase-like GNAT family acetyltransferase
MDLEDPDFSYRAAKGNRGSVPPGIDEIDGSRKIDRICWIFRRDGLFSILMEIRIRPARLDDAEALTNLSMLSKQSNGYDDEFMDLCADELRVTRAGIRQSQFWIAEADSICGCACVRIESDEKSGEVDAFFIHPDWQRMGVGSLLWCQILQYAKAKGLLFLHLDADPNAEPFYRKLGFQTVRQTPSGSIVGRTIPYMELVIGVAA